MTHTYVRRNVVRNVRSGFTLIELLVVVAIIGILAAVVLAALDSARAKGDDAAVQSNLNSVRNESEIFSSNNGNSFLPEGGSATGLIPCPAYNANGTTMFALDKNMAQAIAEAAKRGGNGAYCVNSAVSWAVAVGMNSSNGTTSWCVDASGASKLVNAPANMAATAGTASCK